VRAREAGFSLIEVLIAAALFIAVGVAAFEGIRQLIALTAHASSRHLAYESLERLTAQLRAEARSATAITLAAVPPSGHDACTQVDFYVADASGPHFWSYRNFPNHTAADAIPADALERLAGTSPIAACDAGATGQVVASNVRVFTAATLTAAALSSHTDPYLTSRDSPFVGSAVANASVGLGVLGATGTEVTGGNGLIEVRLANDAASRVVDLLPGVFPTGYTLQLTYACDDRCTVGHDTGGPKTITACALSGWQYGWSRVASYTPVPRTDGSGIVDLVASYWIAGYFVFTYSGTAPDGTTDRISHVVLATNDGETPANGTHGAATPFDAPPSIGTSGAALTSWYQRFLPYVDDAGMYNGTTAGTLGLQQESQRCANVQSEGVAGGYSYD
jgi:Tfp pilus assembly protein PilV